MPLAFRVLAGAALLGVLVWYVDPARLWQQLRGMDLALFGAAVSAGLLSNLASALRWSAIARRLDLAAPTLAMILLYARGMSANVLLPGAPVAGDVLRAVHLSRLGNGMRPATLSVVLDRLSGLWILCAMSLVIALGLLVWQGAPASALLPRPAIAAYVALLALTACVPFVSKHIWRSRQAFHALLPAAGYSVAVQLASGAALWICGLAAGLQVPLVAMLGAAAPIFIMAALPIGVAGFGAREAASLAILGALGAPGEQAVACGLLYGLASVVQGVLVLPAYAVRITKIRMA